MPSFATPPAPPPAPAPSADPPPGPPPTGIDWAQVWYPGPRRAFTPDEMARAGSDAPSATLQAAVLINLALLCVVLLQLAPREQAARLAGVLVAVGALLAGGARWLWWRPWRRPLLQLSMLTAALLVLLATGVRWRVPDRGERLLFTGVLAGSGLVLPLLFWFVMAWRAQQIGARLREQAERAHAVDMARRLAAAQIEPHFLFNTLASLQHWVQTQDARAAPLLAALTGYLRATLPLFDRPLLPAGDELLAVERYLQVMQARLGGRLAWHIDVMPALRDALLPPGLLLTLTENAVVHGIEPHLAGGSVRWQGRLQDGQACFACTDDGPGLPVPLREGVGITNIRQRLALLAGGGAQLVLTTPPGGGCRAELRLPYRRRGDDGARGMLADQAAAP